VSTPRQIGQPDASKVSRDTTYSSQTNTLNAINGQGYYWVHLSADVPANSAVDVTLTGVTTSNVYIRRTSVSYTDVDTMSRDGVVIVPNGGTLGLRMGTSTVSTGTISHTFPHFGWTGCSIPHRFLRVSQRCLA
jgi:hypothetical protein